MRQRGRHVRACGSLFGSAYAPRVHGSTPKERSWRDLVVELASFGRPSAYEGERRAAELIAERLRAEGCDVAVEREQAHGTYWWPIGLANLLAVASALIARRGSRLGRTFGALAAGVAAAALWDDLGHGSRWFRRALLPHRPTWNALGWVGDPEAPHTIAFVAHHDAAHSGLVFHPALGRIGPRLLPGLHERSSHTLPILYGVWLGPALVCAGAALGRRDLVKAGAMTALGAIAAMSDIGTRQVVAGANDNLAAVGVLVALAERLRQAPIEGVRVLLLSTGSEESFSEGMQAFVERHAHELDPATTEFVCLECLAGPTLIVLEGEGMLRMRDYDAGLRDALAEAAARAGVSIARGLRTVAATDAIIALRAGYRTATLASVTDAKLPLNYHWPNDTPEHLHWDTVEDAIATCESFLQARSH